jgi:hypothetical protein
VGSDCNEVVKGKIKEGFTILKMCKKKLKKE